jgi:hypothetical protein
MAQAITHFSAPGLALTGLKNVWAMIVWLGENSSRARMIRELSAMSDAELAERGLDRTDLVKRVFDDGYYI